MRVLVTTTGSAGHLGPLIPFADAIRDAGGEVLMATRASTAPQVRAAGYDVREFGEAPQAVEEPFRALSRLDGEIRARGVADQERVAREDEPGLVAA